MDLKKIKKEAKENIENNYFKSLLVVFICTILVSGGVNLSAKKIFNIDTPTNKENTTYNIKTNIDIIDNKLESILNDKKIDNYISNKYTRGYLSILVNEIVSAKYIIFSQLNSISKLMSGNLNIAIIIIIVNILIFIFKTFFFSILDIGKIRYFLEQRRYLKTNIDRTIYPYTKNKNYRLTFILLLKNIYLFLWGFTIIGFFIKYYEYSMIPYILAENPNIKKREAFKLSRELMDGNKFNMFKLDLYIIGYKLLGYLTFNILNTFYTDIYEETLHTEFYVNIRENKLNTLEYKYLLNDEYLYLDNKENRSYEDSKKSITSINYNRDYNLYTYILLFFTFSFVGWSWEVILHLLEKGTFVNRGSFYGPWLPIYGCGGILILKLLKKYRNNYFSMFIYSIILCGLVEYLTSLYLEVFKHLKYWNYTGYFLNINGRICLEGLIAFGLGGCSFTYIFAPLLDNLYQKIDINIKKSICIILIIVFSIDFLYSTIISPNTGKGINHRVEVTHLKE